MPRLRRTHLSAALLVPAVAVVSSCSGSSGGSSANTSPAASSSPASSVNAEKPVPAESNPPGDIPDNLAFVTYANTSGHYRFVHPEGWAETQHGVDVLFTDKLNGVQATSFATSSAPTEQSARSQDVPRLRNSVPAFELRSIKAVTLPAGTGVLIVYRRNSTPDPVTGRQYRDEVEEFEIYRNGREVRLDLFGPVGADNVDAYKTMSQGLRLT
jgi:hypothetical protein